MEYVRLGEFSVVVEHVFHPLGSDWWLDILLTPLKCTCAAANRPNPSRSPVSNTWEILSVALTVWG